MNQYPTPSQNPSSPYGGGSQQPSTPPEPAGPRAVRVALPTSVPYVTYALVGITAAFYLLQTLSVVVLGYPGSSARPDLTQVIAQFISGSGQLDWLEALGDQIQVAILHGQVWRLLTPLLLHVSIVHIGFNMYALWIFGIGLERNFGHWRFLALYLLGGFAGNVLSFVRSPGPSEGASTAIFGLVAAEGIFLYQNRELFGSRFRGAITNIIFVVVFNLGLGQAIPNIDNWGHVGGLLGGLIFAWFAAPKWEVEGIMPALHVADKREARDVVTGAAITLLIFGGLAAWGMLTLAAH